MDNFRFMTVSKTFQEMLKTPRIDCMIMTRETFKTLEKYLDRLEVEPGIFEVTGQIKIFFHQWMGDLIVYGDSKNQVIRTIIGTCEGNSSLSLKGGGT